MYIHQSSCASTLLKALSNQDRLSYLASQVVYEVALCQRFSGYTITGATETLLFIRTLYAKLFAASELIKKEWQFW